MSNEVDRMDVDEDESQNIAQSSNQSAPVETKRRDLKLRNGPQWRFGHGI